MAKRTLSKKTATNSIDSAILFNSSMRQVFVEGILQDIKGYFENKTNGNVAILYEECNLKNHEFSFKMRVEKTKSCTKQMWSEATSAIINVVNYMFPYDSQLDIAICTESIILEIEIASTW